MSIKQHEKLIEALQRIAWLICLLVGISACQIELNSGLDEAEANEMMAILLKEGIPTTKVYEKGNTVTLKIGERNFSEAVTLLQSRGLPRTKFSDLGSVFKQDSMISTPTEEWARFLYARSQELSQTVGTIAGVLTARVHIAIPKKDSVLAKAPSPTASVLVRVNSRLVSPTLVPQIKRLVTYSVEELTYENVSVVVTPVDISDTPPALVSLYGLIVHEASTRQLQYAFYCLVSLIPILIAALFGVYRLGRRKSAS